MSPAPRHEGSNRFSNRIRGHEKLAEHWNPREPSNPCIWAINDELLFLESASPVVPPGSDPTDSSREAHDWLTQRGVQASLVTTLFSDLEPTPGVEDVHLVRLAGQSVDVFGLTQELRAERLSEDPLAVSPNHILIPAGNGDGCPSGPPSEYEGAVPPPIPEGAEARPGFSPSFTLIDSGYQWDGHWGANPLDALLGHPQPPAILGSWPTNGRWQRTPREELDADHDHRLDALAGHANFAAGVLARRCDQPTIAIWNHNASFVGGDARHIPTELAVLRSLLKSQQDQPAPVIVVVFAFAVLGNRLGRHWENAWARLKHHNPNFVLVAPAGNQSDTARRYPAAWATDHDEVIGVASLDEKFDCSEFSNRGTDNDPWVTCSAVGEEVVSTFLHTDLEPEEDEERPPPPGMARRPHNFATNDWAIWQGTSFAAPKVAAAIANQLDAAGGDAMAAWGLVRDTASDRRNDVGLVLDQL